MSCALPAVHHFRKLKRAPFAPPYLVAGKRVIAQTANILLYLGPRLRLAPKGEAGRLWAHQLQLTIADWLVEVHDTHHPIGSGLYYEEQRREAKRRAADFRAHRLPKYLDYFEGVLRRLGRALAARQDAALTPISRYFRWLRACATPFRAPWRGWKSAIRAPMALHRRVAAHPRLARLPRLRAPHSIQSAGYLPALSGARLDSK